MHKPAGEDDKTSVDNLVARPKTAASVQRSLDPFCHNAFLLPGAHAGNWVIERHVSSGGGGDIYAAHHAQLRREAAIKVLHQDLALHPTTVRRFMQEAEAVNLIRHPAIIDIFDLAELPDGRPFLVMEWLKGETLHDRLKRRGRLSLEDALVILDPLAQALHAAHAAGFVHRDVKAANVHVGLPDAASPRVVLLDFGIAKALHPEQTSGGLTTKGARLGSPTSMAPEQITGGAITSQTDVYSLGALLFRMLTGRHPFAADSVFELERLHLEAPIPKASSEAPVPTIIDRVLGRAMAKSPLERYGSVVEFFAAATRARSLSSFNALPAASCGLGVGVAVELELAENPSANIRAVMDGLDYAERTFVQKGFPLVRVSGYMILGARLLSGTDSVESKIVCAEACEIGRQIADVLTAGAASSLVVRVSAHVDALTVNEEDGDIEAASGSLLEVPKWFRRSDAASFCSTDALLKFVAS